MNGEPIPARTPTLSDLHRRWMHARLAHEQAERAVEAAREVAVKTAAELKEATTPLAKQLLTGKVVGGAGGWRRRKVAVAGEVLDVYELGVDYPGEFGIDVISLEVVALD